MIRDKYLTDNPNNLPISYQTGFDKHVIITMFFCIIIFLLLFSAVNEQRVGSGSFPIVSSENKPKQDANNEGVDMTPFILFYPAFQHIQNSQ